MELLNPLLDAYEEPVVLAGPIGEAVGKEHALVAESGAAAEVLAGPPAPLADGPMPKRRRRRTGLETVVTLEYGNIYYFPSNGNFEARCQKHQGRCTLTRRAGLGNSAGSSTDVPGHGGRPLGLLAAWLSIAEFTDDKAAHKHRGMIQRLAGAEQRSIRAEARRLLEQVPGSEDLFAAEAPSATGEAEPEVVA